MIGLPLRDWKITGLWHRWKTAWAHAVLISLFEIGLFYYWFGVADRYAVFLYGHYGAGPFAAATLSRYLMTGLVASGAVLVVYGIANWFAAHLARAFYRRYTVPEWWKVWVCCLPFLIPVLPLMLTTLNQPTLPLPLALLITVIAVGSFPLALMPGRLAAEDLGELVWLALAGLGLTPSLLLLRAVELTDRMLAEKAFGIAVGSILAGAVWSSAVVWIHSRRRGPCWRVEHLLVSAFSLAYLLGPLAHYLLFTPPGYRYITVAANFFAEHPATQVACFLTATVLAGLTAKLQYFSKR